ncbi:MAG: biotin--[acetyl-CoA-carboxylase] ligase [Thermodesulfovibrionales bacterium]|jgi:BirA family biotin operon repressor/biotin-[acetyl-CoA-carboxylase] ligase
MTDPGWVSFLPPDLWAEEMKSSLSGLTGREILLIPLTKSTNTLARELAHEGCPEGTVVMANDQTEGRGRHGRRWIAPQGKNISMSIVLYPALPFREAGLLTLMSAVACASALRGLSVPASIKWPNDIMISGKKIGGILTELRAEGERIIHAIMGIGINVNILADEMPEEIRETATSLAIETGTGVNRTDLSVRILREIDSWYERLLREGSAPVREEWLRLSSTIGKTVKVTMPAETITGKATGIDETGMLLLSLSDGSERVINSGDLTMVR